MMKPVYKAVLLSAVVYPGAGHFYLKKSLIGFIFAALFTVLFVLSLQHVFSFAQCIANEISTGKIPLDISQIVLAVQQPSAQCRDLSNQSYFRFMLIVWICSVFDVYRMASKRKNKGL